MKFPVPLKKHISPENHLGYGVPYSLFESPLQEELEDIALGREAFSIRHPDTSLFPDPFFDPIEGRSNYPLSRLKIIRGMDSPSGRVADSLASAIKKTWGVDVPVLSSDDPHSSLRSPEPLLLIGGADVNLRTMEIAKRYQVGLFCRDFAGRGGWGITCYWELEERLAPRYVLSCDEQAMEAAIAAFVTEAIETVALPSLRWMHRVLPGYEVPGVGTNFDDWLARRPCCRFPAIARWIESGCKERYRDVFAEFFNQDFAANLPYNAALIDIGLDAIRYYQFTGDESALDLFRETMWGFWDYFTTPDPQVYISDLDFRLGLICNYWNYIEHHPAITAEERRVFPKLLLGAMRMVSDYFRHLWKNNPGPHNHQTFKARTLILGWRYFRKWKIPDVLRWKEDADSIFEPISPHSFKHKENAAHYERFVPEHTLVWFEVSGRPLSAEFRSSLAKFAQREWATRDSLLTPVDYGDSDPSMERSRPFPVAPWLKSDNPEEAGIIQMELASEGMFSFAFPDAVSSFCGIRQSAPVDSFSGAVGWEHLPLDPLLEKRFQLQGDPACRFDKLVWRSAWTRESPYIALEGYGNTSVSHAHNEVNGVLRMNLAGRIWLVSNGYGKGRNIEDAATAFRTRQRGPEDHNMLIIRAENGDCITPPINAVVADIGHRPVSFCVTEVSDYGGFFWRRHTFLMPEGGFVIIDKVVPLATGSNPMPMELQWNILGERRGTAADTGARFEQDGATLVFMHFGTAEAIWEESQITAWRGLIANGQYPYSKAMPTHCILKTRAGLSGKEGAYYFVSGFWLEDSLSTHHWEPRNAVLSLGLAKGALKAPSVSEHAWGRIDLDSKSMIIALQ